MLRTLLLVVAATLAGKAAAETPKVAADIAPVHSLVARIMEGVAEPSLIIPPGASPHDHAMRPSEARALQSANVVFWVGPELTPWMERPLSALSADAVRVELLEVDGTTRYSYRDLADDHDGHDDHAQPADHEADADHDGHDHHDNDGIDPHAWLDPENARVWVRVIAETLASSDPENAKVYLQNARVAEGELGALQSEIEADFAKMSKPRFITFHDAYQYFEVRFGLSSSGTVSLGDATAPGPARLAELKAKINSDGIDCAFSEPQFDTRLVNAAIEGVGAQVLVMDPIGVTLDTGPSLYPTLLRAMATSYQSCSNGS